MLKTYLHNLGLFNIEAFLMYIFHVAHIYVYSYVPEILFKF